MHLKGFISSLLKLHNCALKILDFMARSVLDGSQKGLENVSKRCKKKLCLVAKGWASLPSQ